MLLSNCFKCNSPAKVTGSIDQRLLAGVRQLQREALPTGMLPHLLVLAILTPFLALDLVRRIPGRNAPISQPGTYAILAFFGCGWLAYWLYIGGDVFSERFLLIIAIISWAGPARGKRAQVITLRHRDFVTAAKFSGEGTLRIVFFEIMPNMTSLVAAAFVAAATGAIYAEAFLAVLGLGSSDSVSWGTILYQADAAGAVSQGLFAWVFVPGLVLAILITAMSFINFGVDLLSNPHLREQGNIMNVNTAASVDVSAIGT